MISSSQFSAGPLYVVPFFQEHYVLGNLGFPVFSDLQYFWHAVSSLQVNVHINEYHINSVLYD